MTIDESTTWNDLLEHTDGIFGTDVRLQPLARLVETMRCTACTQFMDVRSTAWLYEAVPRCLECSGVFPLVPSDSAAYSVEVHYDHVDFTRVDLLPKRIVEFGLGSGDVIFARPYAQPNSEVLVLRLRTEGVQSMEGIFTAISAA